MNNEEIREFNEILKVFNKHYNGEILNEEEIDIILKTDEETVLKINEIFKQERLRKKDDGSLEKYLINKRGIDNLKFKYRTNFDKEKKSSENISFESRLKTFIKHYEGKNLTPFELDIIARTPIEEILKIDRIVVEMILKNRKDGSYLTYIRNCDYLFRKKISFDNFPVKRKNRKQGSALRY